MAIRTQSLEQYRQLNQSEMIRRALGSFGGKVGLPVAAKDINLVAAFFQGRVQQVPKYDQSAAAIIIPGSGQPKVYLSPQRLDYRDIFLSAMKQLGIEAGNVIFHVDHALASILARQKFEYVLTNPVLAFPNTSFGSFEKASTDRVFTDPLLELASITEILKICEIAPAKRGNLAEDCLIGVINARESGIIRKSEVKPMLDLIRHSKNNLVAEAYEDVKQDFEQAAKTIE